jgi:superfamily I DNA/RNA helicase
MSLDLLQRLYDAYHEYMYGVNAMDYNCLLSLTVHLLENFPQVRDAAQERFAHLLVDEFQVRRRGSERMYLGLPSYIPVQPRSPLYPTLQDTNTPQFAFIRLIKGSAANSLFVVGDPDQAIYGWRGATAGIMESGFQRCYPHNALVYMNNNYRSVPAVLAVAEAVLSHDGTPELHQPLVAVRDEDNGHAEHVSRGVGCDIL